MSLATRITVLEELIEAIENYVPQSQGSFNLETIAKAWLAELREEQAFLLKAGYSDGPSQ